MTVESTVVKTAPYLGALVAASFAGSLHTLPFYLGKVARGATDPGNRLGGTFFGVPDFLELWDLDDGRHQARVAKGCSPGFSFAFRPDGRQFAVELQMGTELRDATTGQVIRVLKNQWGRIAFGADGRRLLLVDVSDAGARLFETDTGRLISTWKVTKGTWGSFALSPDGRQVASGDEDGTLRLWDADTGRELAHWRAHEAAVTALAYHPDGTTLVSGGGDGTVKLWDLPFIRKELAALGLDW